MSDTPRTDAFEALLDRPMNWRDFARELERENAALREEVEQLKGALALGQQNCDDAYNDLREERDEAKAENAALRELSARMADEMREIDHEFASLRDYEQASKEVKP